MDTHPDWRRASCGGPGLVPSTNSCSSQGAASGVMLEMGNQQVRSELLPRLGLTHVLELRGVLGDLGGNCPSPLHHGVVLVPLPVYHAHLVLTPVRVSGSLSCGFPSPSLG